MSNLTFVVAQPDLLDEFKEFLSDRGQQEYDEETATDFLHERENRIMDFMEYDPDFEREGRL